MTGPLRALIVDDELLARRNARLLLDRDPAIGEIREAASGLEAITCLEEWDPDLVILDVELGDMDGFGVLEELAPERIPLVIFATAYDDFAIRAFDVHAIDYLLKPFSDQRFREAIERARERIDGSKIESLRERLDSLVELTRSHRPSHLSRLLIRKSGRIIFLPVGEVDWFEADDYYVRVHTGERSHLLRRSLSRLEQELDPQSFRRVHRSAIVNLERIVEISDRAKGDATIHLSSGAAVRVSRSRRAELEQALAGRA